MWYNHFMDQILEYINKRAASTILVSFTVSWVICHAEPIFVTLFVNQELIMEKTGLLKNEYMEQQHLLGVHVNDCWWWARTILPFAMAYIYVWWLPKFVINPSYRKEVGYKYQRKRMKLEEEKKLAEEEQKLIKQVTKNEEAKVEWKKAEAKIAKIDPEAVWEEDYRKYINLESGFGSLAELKNTIYGRAGDIRNEYGAIVSPADFVMLWDTNGLVEFDMSDRAMVELTAKGKFFLKKFSEEQLE